MANIRVWCSCLVLCLCLSIKLDLNIGVYPPSSKVCSDNRLLDQINCNPSGQAHDRAPWQDMYSQMFQPDSRPPSPTRASFTTSASSPNSSPDVLDEKTAMIHDQQLISQGAEIVDSYAIPGHQQSFTRAGYILPCSAQVGDQACIPISRDIQKQKNPQNMCPLELIDSHCRLPTNETFVSLIPYPETISGYVSNDISFFNDMSRPLTIHTRSNRTGLDQCFRNPQQAHLRSLLDSILQQHWLYSNQKEPEDTTRRSVLTGFLQRAEPDNTFVCLFDGCGKAFDRQDRAVGHIRMHLGLRPFSCDGRCGELTWYAKKIREADK